MLGEDGVLLSLTVDPYNTLPGRGSARHLRETVVSDGEAPTISDAEVNLRHLGHLPRMNLPKNS